MFQLYYIQMCHDVVDPSIMYKSSCVTWMMEAFKYPQALRAIAPFPRSNTAIDPSVPPVHKTMPNLYIGKMNEAAPARYASQGYSKLPFRKEHELVMKQRIAGTASLTQCHHLLTHMQTIVQVTRAPSFSLRLQGVLWRRH
jgi:hypothetical protein